MEVFVSTERLHRSPRAHEGLLQRIVGKRTATPTSGSYVRELGPVRLDHAVRQRAGLRRRAVPEGRRSDDGERRRQARHLGSPRGRDAEILEVCGEDGGPPYLVRWADDGHIGLIHPGPDAVVEHLRSGADAA